MATSIENIPAGELQSMKKKVIAELNSMNEDELKIALQSKDSLAKVIAGLFRELAYAIGYAIAYPIAFAAKIVESVWNGLSDGFEGAFKNVFK